MFWNAVMQLSVCFWPFLTPFFPPCHRDVTKVKLVHETMRATCFTSYFDFFFVAAHSKRAELSKAGEKRTTEKPSFRTNNTGSDAQCEKHVNTIHAGLAADSLVDD